MSRSVWVTGGGPRSSNHSTPYVYLPTVYKIKYFFSTFKFINIGTKIYTRLLNVSISGHPFLRNMNVRNPNTETRRPDS